LKTIGLTGGIGSGKTAVADMFSSFGVPVFNADDSAKEQYKKKEVLEQVIQLLGTREILDSEGQLIRSKLAAIIFNDPVQLNHINELIHPLVKKEFEKWRSGFDLPYCIREAAILIESGSYKDCDQIIVVISEMEARIKRVMERDGASRQEVEKRIRAQMSDEERLKYAQFIIQNNGSLADLYAQVLKIHEQLL
jgi:dephospho-CoA kinase